MRHMKLTSRLVAIIWATLTFWCGPAVRASASDYSEEVQKRYGFEITPYRVLVKVDYQSNHLLNERTIIDATADFEARLNRNAGNTWHTTTEKTASKVFQVKVINTAPPESWKKFDKVFRYSITPKAAGISIAGFEYDVKTETETEMLIRTVSTSRFLAHELTLMTATLFRPLAAVDVSKTGKVSLRQKASRIACPNPEWLALQKQDLLTVSRLYRDREGIVKKRYDIPWTFLRITEQKENVANCEVISAFRSPLAGIQRRVETIAIKAVPLLQETDLTLKKRKPKGKEETFGTAQIKLAHNYVPGEPVEFHTQQVTTRLGQTSLKRDENPIQYLFVYSGETVLAKVPCVPGLHQSQTLVVPDDSVQLKVDGELSRIKDDLIDLVARRTVLFARAKILAKQGRFDLTDVQPETASSATAKNLTVNGIVKQIENLPTKASFDRRILAVRVPAVDASLKAKDRVGANRITQQCSDVEKLVERYLTDDKLKKFKEEIDELKKVSEN